LSSGKKIRGGVYEKSVRPDILEDVVHYTRRALVGEVPAEVHIKENS